MVQELGRIPRPAAEHYKGRRKLLLVPLVYGPPDEEGEGVPALHKYWEQMQEQVESLESGLGSLRHIYHESISEEGQEGIDRLGKIDQRSHKFVKSKCESGATLEATEDAETLVDTLDLQRCLMLPFASRNVVRKLEEWFNESNRKRYEHISKRIDATLGEDETGLLLFSERHHIQFPADIEVFYVSPPALDEFRRWLQDWITRQQVPSQEPKDAEQEEEEEQKQE